jgi:two-component system, LytTR family, response regulator
MSAQIRTVIADDEPLARRMLRELLAKDTQLAIVGEARDGVEAADMVRRFAPDLLLLDVQMPNADGFAAIRDLPQRPVVIFITAHAEHAVRAFDADAADYLLKPFDDQRFERALTRAKAAIRTRGLLRIAQDIASDTAPREPQRAERIALNEGRRVVMVDVQDIEWIEAADYYAQVHVRGTAHLVRESLQDLADRLGPQQFMRIHRGALVNVQRVQRLERAADAEVLVVLDDGTRLRVSRSRRQQVAQMLGAR